LARGKSGVVFEEVCGEERMMDEVELEVAMWVIRKRGRRGTYYGGTREEEKDHPGQGLAIVFTSVLFQTGSR
jgi:hypothetical protein